MKTYKVKVKIQTQTRNFNKRGFSSAAVAEKVSARFGGLCSVFVVLA